MFGPIDWLNIAVGENGLTQLSTKSAIIINASNCFFISIFPHSRLISNRPPGRLNPKRSSDACNARTDCFGNPGCARHSHCRVATGSHRGLFITRRVSDQNDSSLSRAKKIAFAPTIFPFDWATSCLTQPIDRGAIGHIAAFFELSLLL